MIFYYLKKGTKEQEEILKEKKGKMNNLYNQYLSTFKTLSNEECKNLWSKYLDAKKEVEKAFEPFGFICY